MGVQAAVSKSLKISGLSRTGKFIGQAERVNTALGGKSEGQVRGLAAPRMGCGFFFQSTVSTFPVSQGRVCQDCPRGKVL